MCVGYLGLGAAWKVADISEKSTVVIFGLGTVGLSVSSLLEAGRFFHTMFQKDCSEESPWACLS